MHTPEDVKQLLAGTHVSQNRIQTGWKADARPSDLEKRTVGEQWLDEDGVLWEQASGYKKKLGTPALDESRNDLLRFRNCPKEECTCTFPRRLDNKMRAIHGMCFQCVTEMEHKIRIEKKWDEYEAEKQLNNAKAFISDAEKEVDILVDQMSRAEYINEFGDVEKWEINSKEIVEKIRTDWGNLKNELIEKGETLLRKETDVEKEKPTENL